MGDVTPVIRRSQTTYFDASGQRVFPCRCGETHAGPYAEYDYGHHECLHDATLLFVESDDPSEGDCICPLCGQTWVVRHAS